MLSSQGLKDNYVLIRTNKETIFSKRSFFFILFLNAFSLDVHFTLAVVRSSASRDSGCGELLLRLLRLATYPTYKISGSNKFQIRIGSIPMLSLDSSMCNCVTEIKHIRIVFNSLSVGSDTNLSHPDLHVSPVGPVWGTVTQLASSQTINTI